MSNPRMPIPNARPPFSSQSSAGPALSANSLSGPPIAGQPPVMAGGGRQAATSLQQRPNYPSQGIVL